MKTAEDAEASREPFQMIREMTPPVVRIFAYLNPLLSSAVFI
jgi:hypothetical protein